MEPSNTLTRYSFDLREANALQRGSAGERYGHDDERRYRFGARSTTSMSRYEMVARVALAMRERLAEQLSLEELAEWAYLSPYHFSRVFRLVTGLPPHRFLAALRMEEAKRLLLTTGFRVTDICFEVGYNSLGTFTTQFTQLVGVPPRRLRQLVDEMRPLSAQWLRDHILLSSGGCQDGPRLVGEVRAVDASERLIFVGLFKTPLPLGKPAACASLTMPGTYHMAPVPDGEYYVTAAAVGWFDHIIPYLLPGGPDVLVGATRRPVTISGGRVTGGTRVDLRPLRPTDPPVVVALPVLLMKKLDLSA